jgi:Tat protein translocase TatB subunit
MSYSSGVAFLTGSVGTGEWIVLFVVILIVVGPKRLPEVARKIGRMMEMFRRAADEFKDQLMSMDQEISTPSAPAPTEDTQAAEASGGGDVSDSSYDYASAYPDSAEYPGNEGQVENWSSDGVSDVPAAEAEAAGEAASAPDAEAPEKVPEGGA